MPPLPKFRICSSIVIVAFAALLVGLLDRPAAHAQEDDRDFVDVGLILEVPSDIQATTGHDMDVIVVNNGTRTAYDVEVTVDVVSPDQSRFVVDPLRGPLIAPVGQASVDGTSVVWTIPELGPLQREVLTPRVTFEIVGSYDNDSDVHEIFGTVTTASFESDRHKGNNTDRVWSFQYLLPPANFWIQAAVDYSVDVSVDNPQPSPGDTVNFTITAGRKTRHIGVARLPPPIDLKVDIELTGGLSHTGTPSYYSSYLGAGPVSTTYSAIFENDEFTIGTGKSTDFSDSDSVTLPVQVASDAVVDEQCLKATLTGNPPPGNGPLDDAISNNVAKLCLGDPPRVPIVSGEVEMFTIYDCFARQTAPCDGTDGVRLRAVNKNIGPGAVMAPGTTIIQVQDPIARVYDSFVRRSAQQSVTDANTVSWQTASTDEHRDFTGITKGVKIFFSRMPFNGELNNWVKVAGEHITVKGVTGGDPPGDMYIRAATTGGAFSQMKSSNSWTVTYSGTSSKRDQTSPSLWFAEFSTMGTYVLEYTTIGNRDGTNGDCAAKYLPTGVDGAYCDTETYIFHVGPMADLTLEDGGRSAHVGSGEHALTIVAGNNGPENVGGAKVYGLPTGADVIHVSLGTYNSTTGVWDIGELEPRGYYRSRGESEPTLVLSAADGATANVSIANTENYEVCVGPKSNPANLAHTTQSACEAVTNASWNSTPVYDYNADNNTATVTAVLGTGGGESAPASVAVIGTDTAGVFVKWEPVAQVNGLGVTDYEVQRMDSSWTTVAPKVPETTYQDKSPGSDNPDYRVRAVNAAGVPGPWSQTAGRRPGVPQEFTATVAASGTQINLAWSAPADVPGVTVSGYELEVSSDGGDNWTTLASEQSAVSYDHTDSTLAPGATREYRVRTVALVGGKKLKSPWATTSATVAYPKPGVPKSFTASGSSDARATLRWSAPDAVADVTVTGYDLEFSKDGGNTWVSLTEGVTALTFPHTDNTLGADAVRQYRVRAVGTVGSGSEQVTVKSDWAFAVATRDYPTPGAPRNFTARAINQSRVDLSWSEPEAVSGVRVTGYHLDFSTDGNTWKWLPAGQSRTVLSATTESHSHTDDTLPAGAIRQYRLRAVGTDANNAVFESGWVFASVATDEVGAPQNLTAAPDGRNRIDLTWTRPAFGANLVTGYRIDHTPASPEQWRTLEHSYRTSPRSYQHTGLLPGNRYCYRVAAIYAGGTGPFAARACATTEGAPTDLPGEPENLRIAQVGSNYVTLEWDPPSVGGAVEYYEYQSNIHTPVEVSPRTATSVRVGGLQPGSSYEFQVRAGNSYGPGGWSRSILVTLNRAGGAVKATPLDLEVEKGGSGSFSVRLNRSPQWPLMLYTHWEGPDCLTDLLPYQQGQILLPTNPPPSKEFWADFWWGPPEDRYAAPWNVGHDIEMDASGCQGGETAVVEYSVHSLPFSELEGLPMWEELGLNEEEWREKWGVDPLDGASGPSVKVTVSDGGVSGQQSSPGAVGEPTAVTLALDAATVSESVGQVTITATLDGPAPEGGIGGFLFAGEDGTASEDIDFTMPFDIFIPGGQRSATATISITDDDLDEADETVVMSALFDIGTALLEDSITLTITDDDTAGVTVSASGVSLTEDGSASYTVVLDSRPTAAVTIEATSGDTGAARVLPVSFTISPEHWNLPETFTVKGVADDDSNDETLGVTHRVTSQDPKYANLSAATVRVEVSDTTAPGLQGQDSSNRPPTVASPIVDATIINRSGTHEVSLSGVFSDADNDELTVTAASNDEAVATAAVAAGYSSLTVAAKSRGTATITVTANDGNGGTVDDTFSVTVKAAPVVASPISDVSGLIAGETRDVSLSGVFSDADGDALTVTASSSDDAVATVSVASDGSKLTLSGVVEGTATITVTAQDSDGNRVSDDFEASVEGAPEDLPEDLPGEPENLRIAQVGSNYVTLEWDPPSVGGAVEYYEYQSNIHTPVEVSPRTATSVRVGGLQPGSSYEFQVRAGNSYGPGGWSRSILVTLNRAGGAVKATPLDLEVEKGGSGSFSVRLNRSPQWPLMLYTHWEGPDCLTDLLPYQQGQILLPTNPPPSKEFWADFWWGPPEDRYAAPWNVGHDIEMDASGCQGGETAVVEYSVHSLPFSELEGLPMWEELGLNEEEWREKWGVDPLDGASGPSVKVTVVDGAGASRATAGEQGLASVNAGGTAVNVSVNLPPQAAVWRREEWALYGFPPAWYWWDWWD